MLPLVAKELIEQASRRRTYLLRVVVGAVMLVVFAVACVNRIHLDEHGLLGKGGDLFRMLVLVQAWALLLGMPVVMAGSVAAEKENGTLQLLLMTRLGPWDLLFQKLISRCIAAGSVVLVSLPLLGIAYAYGGVDPMSLVFGIETLVMSLLLGASAGLLASTVARTTGGAMVLGYLVLYLGCSIHGVLLNPWLHLDFQSLWVAAGAPPYVGIYSRPGPYSGTNFDGFVDESSLLLWCAVPTMAFANPPPITTAGTVLIASCWPILASAGALIVARIVFYRRADPTGRPRMKRLFRTLDRLAEAGDAALGRARPKACLPGDDPLSWLALRRQSWVSWRYLVRILLPVVVVMLVLCLPLFGTGSGNELPMVWTALLVCLIVGVAGAGANLFAGERASETLDVLLTTPITADDLLHGKVRLLHRLHLAGSIPLLILLGVILLFAGVYTGYSSVHRFLPLIALGDLLLLPALAAWIAVAIGLRIRNRQRAILIALVVILSWWVGGLVLLPILRDLSTWSLGLLDDWDGARDVRRLWILAQVLSPLALSWINGIGMVTDLNREQIQAITVHFLLYGGLTLTLRLWCFATVDPLLRRS